MNEWEIVNNSTHRLRVPGGWIYRIFEHSYSSAREMSCVFVPEVIE